MSNTLRPYVTAPDGRRYKGRHPEQMPMTGEGPYIAELARQTKGVCEVVLPIGRADSANESAVFEVEPARSWRSGARQAFAYAGQTGWSPALALFGPADYLNIYLFLRDRLPTLRLWIWRGRWELTTNRTDASRKHAPLIGDGTRVPDVPDSVWHRRVRDEHPGLDPGSVDKLAHAQRRLHYEKAAACARAARQSYRASA